MADFLLTGAISNAVNMPSLTAEEAKRLRPYIKLAEQLGSFAGQLTETGITAVAIEYEGAIAELNVKPLTAIALTGLLSPQLASRQHGQRAGHLPRARHPRQRDAARRARRLPDPDPGRRADDRASAGGRSPAPCSAATSRASSRSRASRSKPSSARNMLFVRNYDKPGFIGALGHAFGAAEINIATFHLGRTAPGGDAIALVEVDQALTPAVLDTVRALPNVIQVKAMRF